MDTMGWKSEIGRKVWVSMPQGLTMRWHTTGTIVRITSTLTVVKLDGEDREVRFVRTTGWLEEDRSLQFGSGRMRNYAVMNKDNYLETEETE